MSTGQLKWILPGIILVLLVTYFSGKSRLDSDRYATVQATLLTLRQIDGVINQETIKIRNGLSKNYDVLATSLFRMREVIQRFNDPQNVVFRSDNEFINEELAEVKRLSEEKNSLASQFMHANAILDFSLRYFPTTARKLVFRIHDEQGLAANTQTALSDNVNRLIQDVMFHTANPDTGSAKIRRRTQRIEQRAALLSTGIVDHVHHLTNYVGVLVDKSESVSRLMQEIVALPTVEVLDEVGDLYNDYRQREAEQSEQYRASLYVVTLFLIVYLGLVLWRLRYASTALQSTLNDVQVLARFPEENKNAVMRVDSNGQVLYANNASSGLLKFWGIAVGSIVPAEMKNLIEQSMTLGESLERELSFDAHVIMLTVSPVPDSGYVNLYGNDITRRKCAEVELQQSKELAEVTLHSIADGVITTDDQSQITYINPTAEELTGWVSKDAVGKLLTEILVLTPEEGGRELINPVEQYFDSDGSESGRTLMVLYHREGTQHYIEQTVSAIKSASNHTVGAIIVFRDTTERRKLERQLAYQATHDGLTGLTNRTEFKKQLEEEIETVRTHSNESALLYIDLDQFKIVNDTCGHGAGDDLLRRLGGLLKLNIRETDTLSRLGGDEFGVLLVNCDANQARRSAEKLLETVNEFRFFWEGKNFDVGCSIGVVNIEPVISLEELMSKADMACYMAKERGRNRVHVFQTDDEELVSRHGEMQWVAQIQQAVKDHRIKLFVQPIVPLGDSSHSHYEVLIRMKDENGEYVSPGAFIPAAERYGLMPAVDRYVIESLVQFYARNRLSEWPVSPCFAINLSGLSLSDPTLAAFVEEQMARYKIPPEVITFEVTETAAIGNLSDALNFIKQIKSLGCSFSLDDFGSGLSSFAYLKNLPVDYLKIDGCFVRDIVDDSIDRAMVEAINKVGHEMGIQTIAEFVENDAILEQLKEIGVDYAQGYGVGVPAEIEGILEPVHHKHAT